MLWSGLWCKIVEVSRRDSSKRRAPGLQQNEEAIMTLKEKVENSLAKVRPSLQADGGDVQLVDVGTDGIVKVALKGSCAGCPMSQMTLKMGIEKILKQDIPEVTSVESI
jgi:Fe-S cluster biogenesis protein NfuA